MKILDRYLLRNFWSTFGYIVLSCYCLLLLLELFQNFGDILENNTPFLRAVQYLWCAMPLKVLEVIPLALMLAVLFSIGQLAHNNEILAMTAAGVSIFRVAAPLFLSALLVSCLMIGANETIIYSWQKQALALQRRYLEGKDDEVRHRDIRERGEGNRLYLIGEYEIEPRVMHRVQIFDRDPDSNRVQSQLLAERARWLRYDPETDRDIWELTNGVRRQLNLAGEVVGFEELGEVITTGPIAGAPKVASDFITEVEGKFSFADQETSGTIDRLTSGVLANAAATTDSNVIRIAEISLESALTEALAVRKAPEEMNAIELSAYIRQRESMQKSTADYRSKLFLRLLFPFSCVVMMLIGFPFALRAQRGRAMVAGFSLGIFYSIALYAAIAFLSALVDQEIIPPWAPAIIPLILFSFFGVYQIRRSSFSQ